MKKLMLLGGTRYLIPAIKAALGYEVSPVITEAQYNGYWGELFLHVGEDSVFDGCIFSDSIKENVAETDIWVKPGDNIYRYDGANKTFGNIIIHSDTRQQAEEILMNPDKYIHISAHKE